jgi:hypothetical protein
MRLASNVNLHLGATFGYIDFGEATLREKSTGIATKTADADSGTNWVSASASRSGLASVRRDGRTDAGGTPARRN